MKENKRANLYIREKEDHTLEFLGFSQDEQAMNWVAGKHSFGAVKVPEEIDVTIKRERKENGNLVERYLFRNHSEFPVGFKRRDVGIYVPFNDNYEDTEVCLREKCHTHLFCGGAHSYVMALQMSGRAPHLGLKVTRGRLASYSVERDLTQESNDRGDFIVHPDFQILEPGETAVIEWEIFPFETREEFYEILLETQDFPVIRTKQCTWFADETPSFEVWVRRNGAEEIRISSPKGKICHSERREQGISVFACRIRPDGLGEIPIEIVCGGQKTTAKFQRFRSLEDLVENRCEFLVEHQQYLREGSHLDGAFIIYDNEEEKQYYSHMDDHNGGRERICMGILLAKYLQGQQNEAVEKSLKKYIEYVYRELYDRETGTVYNDITRNLDWHRLYNYPWMSVFQLELYRLFQDVGYLEDSCRTMLCYYREGGKEFYGIAIPAVELHTHLIREGRDGLAEQFFHDFIEHCEVILKNGIHYPPFEVRYEQSIVAPAVDCLYQAYLLTKDERFLQEAERQRDVLELFNGEQPDYHQFEVAIRHWDGRWFGKEKRYGDTYPHYWSALSGINYAHHADIHKNEKAAEQAKASFRGVLNLFTEEGRGSCAMVFPETVNGAPGYYLDPWANDQDWALYFALKYRRFVCGE